MSAGEFWLSKRGGCLLPDVSGEPVARCRRVVPAEEGHSGRPRGRLEDLEQTLAAPQG
jgi:hypothetical protein